jgi:hypothetical protein
MSGLKRRGLETETHPPRQSPTLLDAWMVREYPGCPFERYADDAVVHCRTLAEAERVLAALRSRMSESLLLFVLTRTPEMAAPPWGGCTSSRPTERCPRPRRGARAAVTAAPSAKPACSP